MREERERSPVVALGLRMVQANCTVAGERAEANGRIDDRVGLIHSARCASELECGRVMARKEFRVVGAPLTGDPLDPLRGRDVLLSACGARDLRIRDIADEHVPEDVFDVVLDGRMPDAAHQLLAGELVQAGEHGLLRHTCNSSERTGPEDLAHDRGVVHERLPVGVERVEARCDNSVDFLRNRDLVVGCDLAPAVAASQQAAVAEHADELLGIQGIASSALEQRSLGDWRQRDVSEQLGDEPRCFRVFEGRKGNRGGVPLATRPAGRTFVELRPCRPDDEQRNIRAPFDEVVQEREQGRVRPVEILDHQDKRLLSCHGLEVGTPRSERFFLPSLLARVLRSHERAEERHEPRAVALVSDKPDRSGELRQGFFWAVRLEDAGFGLDDLTQRPERNAVPVRETPTLPPRD